MDNTLVLIILAVVFYIIYFNVETKEGFHHLHSNINDPESDFCNDCSNKSRRTCSKCKNCGYSFPWRGPGKCVPGDYRGPYFRDDTVAWEYNYPYGSSYRHYGYPWHRTYYNKPYYGNEVWPHRYFQSLYSPFRKDRWRGIRNFVKIAQETKH